MLVVYKKMTICLLQTIKYTCVAEGSKLPKLQLVKEKSRYTVMKLEGNKFELVGLKLYNLVKIKFNMLEQIYQIFLDICTKKICLIQNRLNMPAF